MSARTEWEQAIIAAARLIARRNRARKAIKAAPAIRVRGVFRGR